MHMLKVRREFPLRTSGDAWEEHAPDLTIIELIRDVVTKSCSFPHAPRGNHIVCMHICHPVERASNAMETVFSDM